MRSVLVVLEGVITLMKIRDRKLTDQHLALAVDKNKDLVLNDHLWQAGFTYLNFHFVLNFHGF